MEVFDFDAESGRYRRRASERSRAASRLHRTLRTDERFDWSRFPDIIDIRGGNGTNLAANLHAHREVRRRVLDLAPATATTTVRFAEAGLGHRAGAVTGSFFGGPGFGLIVAWIATVALAIYWMRAAFSRS
ncbi:hypothetical protein [Amycolatopsis sp. NPDC051071]|uniref:hypothetical protein n=1 Tax=Amycolatopsis sp. NPDC051071 TaxID=3154637 RepID=UPI00342852B1